MSLPIAASAQQPQRATTTLTAVQGELVEKGIVAYSKDKNNEAVRLLQAALDLGEMDVAYAVLGRALTKIGDCDAAHEALERAATAPIARSDNPKLRIPKHEDVVKKLKDYNTQLSAACGQFTLSCTPTSAQISIDSGPLMACPSSPIWLSYGAHTLQAIEGDRVVTRRFEAVPKGDNTLLVAFPEVSAQTSDSSALTTTGVALVFGGAALMGAGGGASLFVQKGDDDPLPDILVQGLFIGGGGLLLTGTLLWLLDPGPDEAPTANTGPTILIGPQSVGVGVSF